MIERNSFGGDAFRASVGMLCPGAEIFDGQGDTEIFSQALTVLPDWVAGLEDSLGVTIHYQASGMLRLIFSREDSLESRDKAKA